MRARARAFLEELLRHTFKMATRPKFGRPVVRVHVDQGQMTVTQCGDAICVSVWGKRCPLSQCMSCVFAPGTLTIAESYNGTQSGPSSLCMAGIHGALSKNFLTSSGTFMSKRPSLRCTISLNSNLSIPLSNKGGVFAPSAASTAAQRSSTTARAAREGLLIHHVADERDAVLHHRVSDGCGVLVHDELLHI